jgi:hypothetical protein
MGPTRREGRATERAVTGGDQKGKNRGVWRRLAGEQRTGGGGVGNGTEGTFYRRALEGKTGDGCARACALQWSRAGEASSERRQREGDAELRGLSLTPI